MSDKEQPLQVASLIGRQVNPAPVLAAGGDEAEAIVAAAKERLRSQPRLNVQRIWCEFAAGRLCLRGQVPSFYHKQIAQVAVAGLDGVTQVVNEIEVVW
jgi:osmotically-inducible protein OsmY